MKVAYCALTIKDWAEAVSQWLVFPALIAGALAALITLLAWMDNWDIVPVIIAASVFAAIMVAACVASIVEVSASGIMAMLGYSEVELEERRLFA